MNTPAIQQAIRLYDYPAEMAWLCFPESEFPEGLTDLLRLCASDKLLHDYAEEHAIDVKHLRVVLMNFIQKAILVDTNSDHKKLGLEKGATAELSKLHYQLLMKIFHPDINSSPEAEIYSQMISNAYQQQRKSAKENPEIHSPAFSEFRTAPKSYYQATQKAESQISNTRSVIAALSTITIFALVAIMGYLYDPANPELVSRDDLRNTNSLGQRMSTVLQNSTEPQVLSAQDNIDTALTQIQKAGLDPNLEDDIPDAKLQKLLSDLEVAYEVGNIKKIKPILANAPEIQGQTDKQLNQKLETLFSITSNRKMLLYDFNWQEVSGKLIGKGKFLSRYHLLGEEQWLTREGIAVIQAIKKNKRIKITHLELDNQEINQ